MNNKINIGCKIILPSLLFFPLLLASCHRLTLPEAADNISPYIVQVDIIATDLNDGRSFLEIPVGSGLLVNKEGYIIAPYHTIEIGQMSLQKIDASNKGLYIVVPAYKGSGESYPRPEHNTGNGFDIVAKDDPHDICLLKLKMILEPNPFNGKILPGVNYSDGTSGTLSGFDKPLSFNTDIPQNNDEIAASSYPSDQLDLVTISGHIKSSQEFNLNNVKFPEGQEGFTYTELQNIYDTNLDFDQGNSGGPIYLINCGITIGISLRVIKSDKETSTVIVPSRYIMNLLNNEGVH